MVKRSKLRAFQRTGGIVFLAGAAMAASFFPLTRLPTLRSGGVIPFLSFFTIAGFAYLLVLFRLQKDRIPTWVILGFAILFRIILLFTPPTLSDDVYRYIWDGHLFNQGYNPYALPVNSPLLDPLSIPLRALVNHNWMASPYLPVAQLAFALVTRLAPKSVFAFQVTAVLLDLATGLLLYKMLKRLQLPSQAVILYLWNPLVVIEFAHGAHVDALMLLFMLLSFYLLLANPAREGHSDRNIVLSALSLAGAVLTKGLPILLVPLFARKWGWKGLAVFCAAVLAALLLFVPGAGWGLAEPRTGTPAGTGIFGALRIYTSYWNYNSSIYHWLETGFSGVNTPGAVPFEIAGEKLTSTLRVVLAGITLLIALLTGVNQWIQQRKHRLTLLQENTLFLRLSLFPLGAFLLFNPTIHPWYVTLVLPFLPFWFPAVQEKNRPLAFIWPWVWFSLAAPFSYLTYIDPQNLREFSQVRGVEYFPFFLLLVYALGAALRQRWFKSGTSV